MTLEKFLKRLSKWSIDVAEDMEEVCVGDGVTEMAKMLQRAIDARDERLAAWLAARASIIANPLTEIQSAIAEFREIDASTPDTPDG